ncbi:MAG: DNA topoisomerase I [Nanoarchaeota archaeon]
MAVEAFLTPSESKITVEKPVKAKPKIEELTTIERPGNIQEQEEPEKAKTSKSKNNKPKAEPKLEKSEKTIKDITLIVTEKPQAALKIASALSSTARKYSENNVPFYELERNGKRIVVASAVGHLFNLTYVKGQSGWPIFNIEWIPSYESKTAHFTKNYYMLLKKLSRRAKEIIIATDFDNEGELIGWNVLRFIIEEKDAKRMKYSTLTKPELEKSYENPMKTLDWGQAYAGETRHKIDWLYGINLSRALMSAIKLAGSFKILSIGRVQGPTLKIIVDRDKEILNFKSQSYWQVFALVDKTELKHVKDIFDKKELSEFENIKSGIAETTEKEEHYEPPHPFDLTTLQRESYAHLKLSPSRTLQIAQSLYLDGIISYPRTSSQKIPKEIEPKKIIEKLSKQFPETKFAVRQNPVEGEKSDQAHPSIFPTGEFKNLQDDEEKLYNLIVKRFLSCFSPDAEGIAKRIQLISENQKKFTANGLTITEKGWTQVYPTTFEEKQIPTIQGNVNVDKIRFEEKETQPPKRYTPASLITLLEKKGLGTKSTRSAIVDTLFDRGYLDGKSIQATSLGVKLIEALEKYSPIIIDENLTKDVEEKMDEILNLKIGWDKKEEEVVSQVKRLITDISKEFKIHEKSIGNQILAGVQDGREQQKEQNTLMPCTKCNIGNLQIRFSKKSRRSFVGCSNYPACTAVYSLPPNAMIKKTDKKSERNLPILIALRKGKRPWEFEFNPNWQAENPNYKKENKEENQE